MPNFYSKSAMSGILLLIIMSVCEGVVVKNVTFISDNDTVNYAFLDKGVKFICNYELENGETIKSISWSKGEMPTLYIWDAQSNEPPEVYRNFEGTVDLDFKPYGVVYIPNVGIGVKGTYQCTVKTNLGTEAMGKGDLTVIDTCEFNWKVKASTDRCKEKHTISCEGIFPKPDANCGVFNTKENVMVGGYTASSIEINPFRYDFKLEHMVSAGSIPSDRQNAIFRCSLKIKGTDYTIVESRPLFNRERGCKDIVSESGIGNFTYAGDKTCMDLHTPNSNATLSCPSGYLSTDHTEIKCNDKNWEYVNIAVSDSKRTFPPFCCKTLDGQTCQKVKIDEPNGSPSTQLGFLGLYLASLLTLFK